MILLSVGLAALAATGSKALRVAAVTIAAVALVLAGSNSYVMGSRVLEGGQIVPGSVRQALPALGGRDGVLYLEGLGAHFPNASLEMPAIYNLANEATPNRLAMDIANNDYSGPAYLGGFQPDGPWFDPNYRWVFTAIPGVRTSRARVARFGRFAVEHRFRRLDVTVVGGIAIDSPRDPEGNAWIQDQLKFLVTGAPQGQAWVRLQVQGSPVRIVGPPGARVLRRRSGRSVICVPVRDSGPVRESVVSLGFDPALWSTPPSDYAVPSPNYGLRLVSMSALRRCSAPRYLD